MKFSYEIFPDQRTIVARYIGAFTLSELVTSAKTLWSDPRYSRKYDGLVDISDSSVNVAMSDFRSLLEFIRGHGSTSEGRWAAVASTPFATACGFMYQRAMVGRHTLEVFSHWETACEFLDVEVPRDVSLGCGAK